MIETMRWYFAIGCDNTVKNPLVVDEDNLPFDASVLREGKEIRSWPASVRVGTHRRDYDGDADDVLQNHLGVPIFSPRLRSALMALDIRGFQYLAVSVFRPNGSELSGFSFANIIERRPALDRARSDVELHPSDYFIAERRGRIRVINRAVLSSAALAGCDAVRLDEFNASVYLSERFKSMFEFGRYTGYSFSEVETV